MNLWRCAAAALVSIFARAIFKGRQNLRIILHKSLVSYGIEFKSTIRIEEWTEG